MAKRRQLNPGFQRGIPNVLIGAHLDGSFLLWKQERHFVRCRFRAHLHILRKWIVSGAKALLPSQNGQAGEVRQSNAS